MFPELDQPAGWPALGVVGEFTYGPDRFTDAVRDAVAERLPPDHPPPTVMAPDTNNALLAVTVPHGASRDQVAQAMRGDARRVSELDEGGDAGVLWMAAPAGSDDFHLSLTSPAAFAIQPASLVIELLDEWSWIDPARRAQIELCLHEAVANAVIHGNMDLSSDFRDEPDGYLVFSQMLSARLADPDHRRRRIDIHVHRAPTWLELAVWDQGAGFDPSVLANKPDANARSGRGLLFMRALTDGVEWRAGGRCVALRFHH